MDDGPLFVESPELERNYRRLAKEISVSYYEKYKVTLENKDFLDFKFWLREAKEVKEKKNSVSSRVRRTALRK